IVLDMEQHAGRYDDGILVILEPQRGSIAHFELPLRIIRAGQTDHRLREIDSDVGHPGFQQIFEYFVVVPARAADLQQTDARTHILLEGVSQNLKYLGWPASVEVRQLPLHECSLLPWNLV